MMSSKKKNHQLTIQRQQYWEFGGGKEHIHLYFCIYTSMRTKFICDE